MNGENKKRRKNNYAFDSTEINLRNVNKFLWISFLKWKKIYAKTVNIIVIDSVLTKIQYYDHRSSYSNNKINDLKFTFIAICQGKK